MNDFEQTNALEIVLNKNSISNLIKLLLYLSDELINRTQLELVQILLYFTDALMEKSNDILSHYLIENDQEQRQAEFRAGEWTQLADKLLFLTYALPVFGTIETSMRWFNTPNFTLGLAPYQLWRQQQDRELVLAALNQIEYVAHERRN